MKITIDYGIDSKYVGEIPTTPSVPTVPGGMLKYYLLPDCESPSWKYAVRPVAPAPAVVRFSNRIDNWGDTTYAHVAPAWAKFRRDVFCLAGFWKVYDLLDSSQKSFVDSKLKDLYSPIKAFNNYHGIEDDDWQESLSCATNIHLGKPYKICPTGHNKGKKMVEAYTFKIYDTPPPATLEVLKDPRIFIATTIRKDCSIGGFPHLGGIPVPILFLTAGEAWIPLEEVRVI